MRHTTSLAQWNFRRRNLNFTIDLHGIAVDDLAIEAQSQLNAKLAFPGSRRADDGDDGLCFLIDRTHERERARRKIIISQMIASSASAPKICEREKRIQKIHLT